MTEFHADDYGLFTAQSERILKCCREGVLNGTSIFANGEEIADCLEMLPEDGLSVSVHLNLMQGRCLAPKEQLPLLVDDAGIFSVSFLTLLLSPLTGQHEAYKQQIKSEFRAQVSALLPVFRRLGQPLRLDGHAHWHLLPVAFDAMMEMIEEDHLDVSYIRIPSEPLGLYLRHFLRIIPFPPINIVKSLLLRILARRDLRRWRRALSGLEQKLFLGVLLSGCFDIRRFRVLLPSAEALAARRGIGLEMLAHPGGVFEPEDISRLTNKNDLRFLTSSARNVEAESFLRLR